MDVATKLPTMEDAALLLLHANAERLERTGTTAQQMAASTLMPLIAAEREAREAAKLSQAQAKAAATKLAKASAPTTKVAKKPAAKRVAKAKVSVATVEGVDADAR